LRESSCAEAVKLTKIPDQHVRLRSSEPLVGLRLQSLLGPGSRHCYGIITLKIPEKGEQKALTCAVDCYRQLPKCSGIESPPIVASGGIHYV